MEHNAPLYGYVRASLPVCARTYPVHQWVGRAQYSPSRRATVRRSRTDCRIGCAHRCLRTTTSLSVRTRTLSGCNRSRKALRAHRTARCRDRPADTLRRLPCLQARTVEPGSQLLVDRFRERELQLVEEHLHREAERKQSGAPPLCFRRDAAARERAAQRPRLERGHSLRAQLVARRRSCEAVCREPLRMPWGGRAVGLLTRTPSWCRMISRSSVAPSCTAAKQPKQCWSTPLAASDGVRRVGCMVYARPGGRPRSAGAEPLGEAGERAGGSKRTEVRHRRRQRAARRAARPSRSCT